MGFIARLFAGDPQKLYTQAMADMDKERYEAAVRKLERAKELTPDSAPVHFSLGFCYSRQAGQVRDEAKMLALLKQSVEAFERSVEETDAHGGLNYDQIGEACFAIGVFYQQQENYDKSVRFLERAVELNPRDAEPKLLLSSSYLLQGRPDEAESLAAQALERGSGNPKALAHWKELRKRIGKEAVVDLPEDQRKRIFAEFMEALDGHSEGLLLLQRKWALERKALERIGPLVGDEIPRDQTRAGEQLARRSALDQTARKHDLRKYEVLLLEEEGREKKWPFRSVAR